MTLFRKVTDHQIFVGIETDYYIACGMNTKGQKDFPKH